MKSGLSLAMRQVLATALVTDWTDTAAGATLELFQNDIVPGPMVAIADFTECDFVGYARKTAIVNWATFNDAPTGDQIIESPTVQVFAAGAIVSPQTAYGWLLLDNARTELLAWGRLDVPYAFLANGDKLAVYVNARLLLNTGQTA